jgi:hypothetical protein
MTPRPLVFVPGLPGSRLLDKSTGEELFPNLLGLLVPGARDRLLARLRGPDDPDQDDGVVAGDPIDAVIPLLPFLDLDGIFKQAGSLYGILEGLGYGPFAAGGFGERFRPVGWDWRLPVDQAGTLLRVRDAIVDLHGRTGEPVTLLCHSTGGLVMRSLLQQHGAEILPLLERIIAIGIPWAGTLQSLPLLAGASGWGPLTGAQTRSVLSRSWAAFDLLPPDPAKSAMTEVDLFHDAGDRPASPLVETAWIAADGDAAAMQARAARSDAVLGARSRTLDLGGIEVVNIVGWRADTVVRAAVDPHGRLAFSDSPEGDGTIPRTSAEWIEGPEVATYLVPIGNYPGDQIRRQHVVLWENQPVRDLLAAHLAGHPLPPYVYAAVDADDAVAIDKQALRVYIVALDPAGAPLVGAYATAAFSTTHFGLGADGAGMMLLPRVIAQNAGHGFFRFAVQFHAADGTPIGEPQGLTVQGPDEM